MRMWQISSRKHWEDRSMISPRKPWVHGRRHCSRNLYAFEFLMSGMAIPYQAPDCTLSLPTTAHWRRVLMRHWRHHFLMFCLLSCFTERSKRGKYYYMTCKEVTCTGIVILTQRLRSHSSRLVHKSSLATTGISNCELPWTSIMFQALMDTMTELLIS